MNRRRQFALLAALAAVCAAGIWIALELMETSATAPTLGVVEAPADDMRPGPAPGDAGLAAPREVDEDDQAPERVAVSEGEEETDGSASLSFVEDSARVPAGSLWLEGRVEFRPGTPLDEEVWVEARGRRFGGSKRAPRRFRAPVTHDGRFRVAFAADTRKGFLDVQGRYLYLAETAVVARGEMAEGVVLQPSLGGAIAGRCTPPLEAARSADAFEDVHVTVMCFEAGIDEMIRRKAEVEPDGTYEIGGLPPSGEYHVSLEARKYIDRKVPERATVRPGEVTRQDFFLEVGVRLTGRVVDPDGEGVEGAQVMLVSLNFEDGRSRNTIEGVQTGADGTFDVLGLEAGEIKLEVSRSGFEDGETTISGVAPGGVRGDIIVTLRRGLSVSGVVQWPDGTPVEAAWVVVEPGGEGGGGFNFGQYPSFKTLADGRFHISGLEPELCTVSAKARGLEPAAEDGEGRRRKRGKGAPWRARLESISAGAKGLILTLVEGRSVSGTVQDDLGEPVDTFRVSATPADEGIFTDGGLSRVFRDPDGAFELEGLEDGDYEVLVRARGYASSRKVRVRSPHGGPPLRFALPRAVSVSGVVHDGAGEPVAGAVVKASHEGPGASGAITIGLGGFDPGSDESARTDDQGTFEYRYLPPGRLELEADGEGHAASDPVEVQIAPGESIEDIVLVLRRGAHLSGEVRGAGAQAGLEVRAREESGRHSESTKADEGGGFEFDHLPAGTYDVEASLPVENVENELDQWRLRNAGKVSETVRLVEGGSHHIVLSAALVDPIVVSGRVTSGGEAAAGVVVICARDDQQAGARTGLDGRYELTVSGAGEYAFRLSRGWGGELTLTERIGDQSPVVVNIELPTSSISGAVRGYDGPLKDVSVTLIVEELAEDGRGSIQQRRLSTNEQGRYEFAGLRAGTYSVQAGGGRGTFSIWGGRQRNTHGREAVWGMELAEGERLSDVDFDLKPGGGITGTALGVDGLPLAKARIFVTYPDGKAHAPQVVTRVDSSGNFVYDGVAEGSYLIRSQGGGLESPWVEVEVHGGEDSEVHLVLEDD